MYRGNLHLIIRSKQRKTIIFVPYLWRCPRDICQDLLRHHPASWFLCYLSLTYSSLNCTRYGERVPGSDVTGMESGAWPCDLIAICIFPLPRLWHRRSIVVSLLLLLAVLTSAYYIEGAHQQVIIPLNVWGCSGAPPLHAKRPQFVPLHLLLGQEKTPF